MSVTACQLHWSAGFLEGEGSFGLIRKQASVKAAQVQREPLERLQAIFGGAIYTCSPNGPNSQPYFQWSTHSTKAAGIAMTLYTLMSPRRQQQIERLLDVWKSSSDGSNALKTHCKRGHSYSGDNLYVFRGGRYCRACKLNHQRRIRAK